MHGLARFAERTFRKGLVEGQGLVHLKQITETIRSVADDEMEGAQRAGPQVACKKGCGHCCHQPVSVNIPEVLYLASYIRENYSPEELSQLRSRMSEYAKTLIPFREEGRLVGCNTTCPFLKDDMCSIFVARPMACRSYNAVDVKDCILFESREADLPGLQNGQQVVIGNQLLFGTALALYEANLQAAKVEMIPALEIALDHEDAAEKYFANEPLFDSTITPDYDPKIIAEAAKTMASPDGSF